MPNVVWIHGHLECGGLLDSPAALKGVQRQQGIVAERYGTAKESLRNISIQVVAKQFGSVQREGPPVDEYVSSYRQGAALGVLPGDLPHAADAGQQVGVGVHCHFDAGHGHYLANSEWLEAFLDRSAVQRSVGVQGYEDISREARERGGLSVPLALIGDIADPGKVHVRRVP